MVDEMLAWKDIATGGAVIISGATVFIVNVFTKRLDNHEQSDKEMFARLFDNINKISDHINTGFRQMDENINKTHIKLLERISDVQQDKNKP